MWYSAKKGVKNLLEASQGNPKNPSVLLANKKLQEILYSCEIPTTLFMPIDNINVSVECTTSLLTKVISLQRCTVQLKEQLAIMQNQIKLLQEQRVPPHSLSKPSISDQEK